MRLLELNFLRVRTTNLEKIPELNFVHFHRRQIILIVVNSKNYSFPIPGPVRSWTPNRDLSSDWPVGGNELSLVICKTMTTYLKSGKFDPLFQTKQNCYETREILI